MKAIILAGGKGTRLWPLSRENYPKQFVEFIQGQSLFQRSVQRALSCFSAKDVFIVASNDYRFHVINQIESIKNKTVTSNDKNFLKQNIVLEPVSRGTAPAVLLALSFMGKKCTDEELVCVFPSDHMIKPAAVFKSAVKKAEKLAVRDLLVIFGVKPSKKALGYGHVIVDKKIGCGFSIKQFIEKPSISKLKKMMKSKVYWNAGIFCFKKSLFFSEIKQHCSKMFKYYNSDYKKQLKSFYAMPTDSIDYAIMQKTKKSALIEFGGKWFDLGEWESFLEYFSHSKGNFSIGGAEFLESNNCFSYSQDKLITMLGLKDVVIVESSDSILAMRKGYSNKVKDLVTLMKKKKLTQMEESRTVYRPWGYYTILHERPDYKVKEIGVYPKKSISLQKHKSRSEHWNVVKGKAEVRVGTMTNVVKKNESLYVARGVKHELYNPGKTTVKIIEVQIGDYLGEDDIVRYTNYE